MINRRFYGWMALLVCLSACRERATWIQPHYAPITEAVYASGHLEPVDAFVVTAVTDGYLSHAHVREADTVKPGDALFTLDHRVAAEETQAAYEQWQLAKQNASPQSPQLQKLYADLKTAQHKLTQDSIQHERFKQLYTSQSVAQVDVESKRMQYDAAANQVQALRETIRATQHAVQQELIQARSNYQRLQQNTSYYVLRSPQSAKVYQVMKKKGELVRKGEPVALLGSVDTLVAMLMIDEAGIAKVKDGQTVLIEVNTDKGVVVEGRLAYRYPYFDNDTQAFKAKATLLHPPDNLIGGSLLQANIIVARKDRALLIPRACLQPNGQVTIRHAGQEQTITIQTGIVSTEWVEVLRGLDATTPVLLPNAAKPHPAPKS